MLTTSNLWIRSGIILIDAGGWTAGRSDFVVITNEEVGICSYKR